MVTLADVTNEVKLHVSSHSDSQKKQEIDDDNDELLPRILSPNLIVDEDEQ